VQKMAELNDKASRAMVEFDCSAATDITGFGLAGHAWEMAAASGMGLRLRVGRIPFYPAAFEAMEAGVISAVTLTGSASPQQKVDFANGVPERWQALIHDPQTSGGLLIAIAPDRAERLLARLKDDGIADAAICGEVFSAAAPIVAVE
jgi:selenide,water dikinase